MKMTKEYFENNVVFAVEFDYGHREWETATGVKELKKVIEAGNDNLSDIDYCCKQDDEKVRKFLNFVDYNFRKNPVFKHCSFDTVLNKAFNVNFS